MELRRVDNNELERVGEAEQRDRRTLIEEETGEVAERGLQHEFLKYPLRSVGNSQ